MSRHLILLTLAATLLAAPSLAWKGESAGMVMPIDQVLEKVETGDYVTIQGEVRSTEMGAANYHLLNIADETGELLVAVPERLYQQAGRPDKGATLRVSGKWDHKALDKERQGVRVQKVEVLD